MLTDFAEVPLVLVSGPAGSGKTTACRLIAGALRGAHLNKDSLTRVFVEALLVEAGCVPSDREGPYYMATCRPLEYQVLTTVAWDLIETGVPVVLDAPFGLELSSTEWWTGFSAQTAKRGGRAIVVAVQVPPATLRQRLENRGAARDRWKLDNWDAFVTDLPTPRRDIPTIKLDNSGSVDDLQSASLSLVEDLLASMRPRR